MPSNTNKSSFHCMCTLLTLVVCVVFSDSVFANILWQGDLETKDTSQFHYHLHPHGQTVIPKGKPGDGYMLSIQLTGDQSFWWDGRPELNRSEVQYKPARNSVTPGSNTYFAFRFMVPTTLSKSEHVVAYWESTESYQQMFRLSIYGETIRLFDRAHPNALWTLDQAATAGTWHTVAMHIHWSTDAQKGYVQFWIDKTAMGKQYLKTLPNTKDAMFINMGLLRASNNITEVIYLDDAIAVDHLDELLKYVSHY